MKAYVLGAEMLAALGDPEVGVFVPDSETYDARQLKVRFAGMMLDGRFAICVDAPEAPKAATSPTAGHLEAVIGAAEGLYDSVAQVLIARDEGAAAKLYDDMAVLVTGWIPRGESRTVSPTVGDDPAVEFVHPDEHERVARELGAAQRLNEAGAHSLKTVRGRYDNAKRELLDYQTWARGLVGMNLPDDSEADIRGMLSDRLMDGVSHDEHERVKAAKHELDEALSKWHDLACDIGDVDGDQHGDAGLRLAVVAAYEEMARDAAKALRVEGERDAARKALAESRRYLDVASRENKRLKGLLDAGEGLLDAWRTRAIGLLGYGTFARWGGDDAGLWRRLLHALARDSTAPVRALLALAVDGEPAHSLERLFDRLDDVLAEAREAIEHGDKVHAAGVEEGRRLEREEAAKRDQTHDEDVRAARDRSEARVLPDAKHLSVDP